MHISCAIKLTLPVLVRLLLLTLKMVLNTSAFKMNSLRIKNRSRLMSSLSNRVGFMFPGQGAQTIGMGEGLYHSIPAAKALYDRASDILGYSLIDKCVKGPKSVLDSTEVAQVAIFVSSLAALEKLKLEDPMAASSATVCMGMSLGEYTALCFAGVFSFEDGVHLTKARGEAMQEAADLEKSGMVAVIGLPSSEVQKICNAVYEKCGKTLVIGNYLMDGNYSVSGSAEACLVLRNLASSFGARTMPLAVAGAFHSSYMEPAVHKLKLALSKVKMTRPKIPVISNFDAKAHFNEDEIRVALVNQVTHPVLWEPIITAMVKSPEFERAYEIGPGSVCRGVVKRLGKNFEVINVPA